MDLKIVEEQIKAAKQLQEMWLALVRVIQFFHSSKLKNNWVQITITEMK